MLRSRFAIGDSPSAKVEARLLQHNLTESIHQVTENCCYLMCLTEAWLVKVLSNSKPPRCRMVLINPR